MLNRVKAFFLALIVAALAGSGALAQDSSYNYGTVWEFSFIKTEPGQFENYMDWLNATWKKEQDVMKKDGFLVSYHVWAVNNPRNGEADLVLALEYKDYAPTAKRLELQKKIEAALQQDAHKMEAASGDRTKLRKQMGSTEAQELTFK